jgi:hypothetical protein
LRKRNVTERCVNLKHRQEKPPGETKRGMIRSQHERCRRMALLDLRGADRGLGGYRYAAKTVKRRGVFDGGARQSGEPR